MDLDVRRLAENLKDIFSRLSAIEKTRQPYQGDWLDMSNAMERDGVDDLVKFTNEDLLVENFFSLGDKVRWKQSGDGSYSYGFVTRVDTDNNRLEINGGNTYTLDGDPEDGFSRGLVVNPLGHPGFLSFDPNITGTGDATFVSGDDTSLYTMTGGIVTLFFKLVLGNFSGVTVPDGFVISAPFTPNGNFDTTRLVRITEVTPATTTDTLAVFDQATGFINFNNSVITGNDTQVTLDLIYDVTNN